MMDWEVEPPLDISEFQCVSVDLHAVVVVFSQTDRRYTYRWNGNELGIANPSVEGGTGPHPAEVLDCLARAVAFHAGSALFPKPPPSPKRLFRRS